MVPAELRLAEGPAACVLGASPGDGPPYPPEARRLGSQALKSLQPVLKGRETSPLLDGSTKSEKTGGVTKVLIP